MTLQSYEALERFLDDVPRGYCTYIEELELCTQTNHGTAVLPRIRADAVISLLSATPRLVKLVLRVSGSLDKSVVAPFPFLKNLKHLSISNCGDEAKAPL